MHVGVLAPLAWFYSAPVTRNCSAVDKAALRALIKAELELGKDKKDPFTAWADGQKSAMESLASNVSSGLDSISSGIAKIVTEGKGKFKSLGAAIRDELRSIIKGMASNLIKQGINQLMAGAIKSMKSRLLVRKSWRRRFS